MLFLILTIQKIIGRLFQVFRYATTICLGTQMLGFFLRFPYESLVSLKLICQGADLQLNCSIKLLIL